MNTCEVELSGRPVNKIFDRKLSIIHLVRCCSLGYTITLLRPKNSRNNRLPAKNLLRKKAKALFCVSSTIWKRLKLLQVHSRHRKEKSAAVVFAKLMKLRFQFVRNPSYTPDLVPSGYCLFPSKKKWLFKKRFHSNWDVIVKMNAELAGLYEFIYADEIINLQ